MYALWLFGSRMENVWGSNAFVLYYFVAIQEN
jgi:membrane associated rhomboid family serine protease